MGCGSSGASSPGVYVDSAMETLMKTVAAGQVFYTWQCQPLYW